MSIFHFLTSSKILASELSYLLRDPHGLPSVEYHHTGAPKIWYSIPESHGIAFYTAMKQLVPTFCRKKNVWLPTDTTMVSSSFKKYVMTYE